MYFIIGVLLVVLELLYFRVADYCNIIDKPNERSSHTRITLRGGGIIFLLAMILHAAFWSVSYPYFLGGLCLICVISFIDDIHSVSSKVRLVFHFSAMLLLFFQWGLFQHFPLWYILVALVFCTGIINAYNFMDGINGITGGYSLVAVVTLWFVNEQIQTFVDANCLYVVLLSLLVFNFFNFRSKAKCFAGDVGSVGIAFILLFFLGRLILVTGSMYWIIFLAVYGVDSVLTIIHRIMLHENIFQPHRKHAYQLMANELHIPHVYVSAFYMALQLIINVGAIQIVAGYRWCYFAGVLGLLCVSYVVFMLKYFKKISLDSCRNRF